jgi:Holliday junction resolvase
MNKMKNLATLAACEVSVSDQAVGKIEAQTKSPSKKLQSRNGGRSSRDKGNRAERAIVRFLQERGFAAERIPLSGSAGGSFIGDLTVPVLGVDRVIEVKVRANGFRELYAWLEQRDLLIVKADRKEPLIILPLRLASEMAAKAGGHVKS